jgi:hypothetical protein
LKHATIFFIKNCTIILILGLIVVEGDIFFAEEFTFGF